MCLAPHMASLTSPVKVFALAAMRRRPGCNQDQVQEEPFELVNHRFPWRQLAERPQSIVKVTQPGLQVRNAARRVEWEERGDCWRSFPAECPESLPGLVANWQNKAWNRPRQVGKCTKNRQGWGEGRASLCLNSRAAVPTEQNRNKSCSYTSCSTGFRMPVILEL